VARDPDSTRATNLKRLGTGVTFAAAVVAVGATAAATGGPGITGGDKITTAAGIAKLGSGGFSGDGGRATRAELSQPAGVAVDAKGNVYIADTRNQRVRKVTPGGTITTIAGGGRGLTARSGPATKAHLNHPTGVAVDGQGNVYIADTSRVYKVSPLGRLTTLAGTGRAGFSGDGSFAIAARLEAYGIAVDRQGNVYIGDSVNHRVREVDRAGLISTFAGDGESSSGGDGSAATLAHLIDPLGVAVDAKGNVYIADESAGRVREVNHSGKIHTLKTIKTIARKLHNPFGVAVDASGNVYVSDLDRVRKITPGGTITTVAGEPPKTSKGIGDGGPATAATLSHPGGLAVDRHGNLYIADSGHAAVRKITYGSAAKS
jgi:sugar lactone lactonase YvrE